MKKVFFIISIAINLILVALEILVSIQGIFQFMTIEEEKHEWYRSFTYYTLDSNIALCIGSISILIASILSKNGGRNKVFYLLKFLGVVTTMVTFITVYIFVIKNKDLGLAFSIHGNLWLFAHTICPILGLVSFLCFDESIKLEYKHTLIPIAFTICYTILIILVYSFGGVVPYKKEFNLEINGWFILLLGVIETTLTTIIAFLLVYLNRLIYKRRTKDECN